MVHYDFQYHLLVHGTSMRSLFDIRQSLNVDREVLLIEVSLKVLSGGYFFILQSLTTSKMRKFQTIKLSQLHKEKLAGLKTARPNQL